MAILIVFYAVLVVLGRQIVPSLDNYQNHIEELLTSRLGVEIRVGKLSGEWQHFSPRIKVASIAIGQSSESPSITLKNGLLLENVGLELDLFRSILAGNFIWEELSAGQVSLSLLEDAEGRWSLNGLSAPKPDSEEDADWQSSLKMLTSSKHIRIEDAQFALQFFSGDEVRFEADDLLAENSGDFHRIAAQLSIDGEAFASALLEGYGDPLKAETFEGRGYLRLHHIDFKGPPGIIFRGMAPTLAERFGALETDVAGEFWLDTLETGKLNILGRLEASDIPLSWAKREVPTVENFSADVTGWLNFGKDWGFRLQNLHADWADADIQPLNLQFSQKLGDSWGQIKLATDHLNLAILNDVLSRVEILPDQAQDVLQALNPRGLLRNLHMAVDLEQDFPLTGLEVLLEDIALDSWRDAPAIDKLSAYLNFKGRGGALVLNTSTDYALHFPGVYDNFMKPGASRGRVDFELQAKNEALTLRSGPIHIDGEAGSIKAAFELYLPLIKQAGAPNMWLIAGLRNSHSRQVNQFIPDNLDPTLQNWLDTAIGSMEIEEGGFIWRGPLAGSDENSRSVQVYARVNKGEVKFDPAWPELTELSAYMSVDGSDVEGRVLSASMGEAQIKRADFLTSSQSNRGVLLGINARVNSPVKEAVDILNRSPLRSRVAQLATWKLGGDLEAQLQLDVPLTSSTKGEQYRFDGEIRGGSLVHRSEDLAFESLHGDITYSDERGLFAENIEGRFWNQAISGSISSEKNGDLYIQSSGQIDPQTLPIWPRQLSSHIGGTLPYRAHYRIPSDGSAMSLTLTSDLTGLESTLPLPLKKDREDPRRFELGLTFAVDHSLLEASLEGGLEAMFRLSGDSFTRGDIALGGIEAILPNENLINPGAPRITLRGKLDDFDFDQWFDTFNEGGDTQSLDPQQLNPDIDIQVGKLRVAGRDFADMEIAGKVKENHWWFYGRGDKLAGELTIPLAPGFMALDLDYLVLPKPDFGPGEGQGLHSFLPRDLPELDFSTLGLRVGEQELGELSFSIRQIPDGVRFANLRGELRGISIFPTPDGQPAFLSWTEAKGKHATGFRGLLSTFDFSGVMLAWDLPVLLNSKEAVFITELAWKGRPWEITPALLTGNVSLSLKDGNFYRAPGAASNALIRLIGLINLDTWVRRLRLDFSDFFGSGVAYDQLEGNLVFKQGMMAFQPIKVELPSGKMRLQGQAGLKDESIDARMVATLPVGTNLPWIAALAGGLPAAAGVYLTSRIFDKQVDKVSSLSYRIKGKWSDPEVKVDKIFSDDLE